jgi:hypothetical protein
MRIHSSKTQAVYKMLPCDSCTPRGTNLLYRKLHKIVHGGLLKPAIKPFLQYMITKHKTQHRFYKSDKDIHTHTRFVKILNGDAAKKLKALKKVEFASLMS